MPTSISCICCLSLYSLPLFSLLTVTNSISFLLPQVMAMGTGKDVIKFSLYSGLSFYLYNEASFLALERLSKSHFLVHSLSPSFYACLPHSPYLVFSCATSAYSVLSYRTISFFIFTYHNILFLLSSFLLSSFRSCDPQCGQHPQESGDHCCFMHRVQVTNVSPRYVPLSVIVIMTALI